MMSMMSFANGEQDFTGEQIKLHVSDVPLKDILDPQPRTPEIIPTIYLNGNILYFATPCDGYTLQIVDAAENICYEVVIPMGTNEQLLPNNLSGEYELRIINGNTCYYGMITIY